MTSAAILPHVTASLNALTVLLLVAGFALIRRRNRRAHRMVMTAAVAVSAAFLACYLVYHFTAPVFVFTGQGLVRPVYYFILISHVVLASIVFPMILLTVLRAWRGRFEVHRGLARWTLPVWMYVSVTGIAVYVMLYHLYRPEM